MAEGDAMEAAQETAKKLNDQAAALREGMPPLSLDQLKKVLNFNIHFISEVSETFGHSGVGWRES